MRVLTIMVAAAALACGPGPEPAAREGDSPSGTDPVAPPAAPGLAADQGSYRLRADGIMERTEIPYSYRNAGADTLYQPTCRAADGTPALSVGLQRRVGDGWENTWHQATNDCLSEPLVIGPGETFRDTLRLILHPQDSVHAWALTPMSDLEGEFRLVWHGLLRTYDPNAYPFGEDVSADERVSPGFSLRRD